LELFQYYLSMYKNEQIIDRVAQQVHGRGKRVIKRFVSMEAKRKTGTLTLRYLDPNPDMATQICSLYVEVFNNFFGDISRQEASRVRVFLEEQIASMDSILAIAEDSLRQFKEEHGLIAVDVQVKHLVDESARIESQLRTIEVDMAAGMQKMEELQLALYEQAQEDFSGALVVETPSISQLRTRLAEKEAQLIMLRQELTEQYPKVIRLQSEIEEATLQLQQAIQTVMLSETRGLNPIGERLKADLVDLTIQYGTMLARREALQRVGSKLEVQLLQIPGLSLEFMHLSRWVAIQERQRYQLANKLQDILLQEEKETLSFVVIEPPQVPRNPSYPRRTLNITIAFIFSLLVGIFYCLLVDYLQHLRGSFRTRLREESS
jgi:succinoglycan biosynthesis transport protein ExoP